MMNILALTLLLSSLITSSVFYAARSAHRDDDVIVTEGHRLLGVEHASVSISAQETPENHENLNSKSSSSSGGGDEGESHHKLGPRELVCDAYGKCKHKIATAIEKTRDTVVGTAHEAADEVDEVEEEARQAIGKVKDRVAHKSYEAKEHINGMMEKAKHIDTGKHLLAEVAENVTRIVNAVKEMTGEVVHEEGLSGAIRRWVTPALGIMYVLSISAAYGMCTWVTFISSYVMAGALPRYQFGMIQSKIYPIYFRTMGYCVGLALLGQVLGQGERSSWARQEMIQGFNLVFPLVVILASLLYLEPRSSKVMFERMKKEKEGARGKEKFTTEPSSQVIDAFTYRLAPNTGNEESVIEQSRPASITSGGSNSTTRDVADQERSEQEAAEATTEVLRLSDTLKKLNRYSSLLNFLMLISLTWHLVNLGRRLNSVGLS